MWTQQQEGLKWTLFSMHPFSHRMRERERVGMNEGCFTLIIALSSYVKPTINSYSSARWLTNPNCACRHFLYNSYEYLIHHPSEDFLSYLNGHKGLPLPPPLLHYVTIADLQWLSNFWTSTPISFQYVFLLCLLLDSHLTIHPSNIGVHLR